MGDESYFDWRETMERRQQESERQVQALLQETKRLTEENDVLRIQVSLSGPPRDQRPRGQGKNSKHNQEATYPGNAEPPPPLMCAVYGLTKVLYLRIAHRKTNDPYWLPSLEQVILLSAWQPD